MLLHQTMDIYLIEIEIEIAHSPGGYVTLKKVSYHTPNKDTERILRSISYVLMNLYPFRYCVEFDRIKIDIHEMCYEKENIRRFLPSIDKHPNYQNKTKRATMQTKKNMPQHVWCTPTNKISERQCRKLEYL